MLYPVVSENKIRKDVAFPFYLPLIIQGFLSYKHKDRRPFGFYQFAHKCMVKLIKLPHFGTI